MDLLDKPPYLVETKLHNMVFLHNAVNYTKLGKLHKLSKLYKIGQNYPTLSFSRPITMVC